MREFIKSKYNFLLFLIFPTSGKRFQEFIFPPLTISNRNIL